MATRQVTDLTESRPIKVENTTHGQSSSRDHQKQQPTRPLEQIARSQLKRVKTEAPEQLENPTPAQNSTLPATFYVNGAESEEKKHYVYQFQAKLTKVYLTETEHQSLSSRMPRMPERPPLMKVLESMAEKLVPVTIPVPKRGQREMFNFFPPSFPVASDKRSSAIAKNVAEKKEVDLSKLLRHPKPDEKNINLTLS